MYNHVCSLLSTNGTNYLFINEIQEITDFQLCLRSLLNEEKCDIYSTRSNAKILSRELATHLSGRYIEIPIHTLSYREFMNFNHLSNSDETLNYYFTLGRMSYIHNLSLEKNVIYEYPRNVYSTIF